MKGITETKIEKKLIEIDQIMALWLTRKLTPYGKISLFKSLMLSKITHILLSLLSPKLFTIMKIRKKGPKVFYGEMNHQSSSKVYWKMLNNSVACNSPIYYYLIKL